MSPAACCGVVNAGAASDCAASGSASREVSVMAAIARPTIREEMRVMVKHFSPDRSEKNWRRIAASRDFFGNERRTNTTRWTPGPAIPAVAPKHGADGDDHSKQHGFNRSRHHDENLRMSIAQGEMAHAEDRAPGG